MPPKKPTQIIVTGQPAWRDQLDDALPEDAAIQCYNQRERYVSHITDTQTAMIIVNGDAPDWAYWSQTPKASPATRRVPIVLVSDDADTRSTASEFGADLTFSSSELLDNLSNIIAQHARMMDNTAAEQLACDCAEPLPALAVEGLQMFNAGRYYKQHDLFEALWVETSNPVRDLYRAILQVGVAYYQVERNNYRGARKMLMRAVQWLEILPDVCQTVDVGQLRTDAYRVRAALEALPKDATEGFDRALLKPVVWGQTSTDGEAE